MQAPSFCFSLSDLAHDLPRLAAAVDRFGRDIGLDEVTLFRTQLVIEELVTNSLTHGGRTRGPGIRKPTASVSLWPERDLLAIEIRDDGAPYDPLQHPAPDLSSPLETRPIGGLGIHLTREFTQSADYRRVGDHNLMSLRLGRGSSEGQLGADIDGHDKGEGSC